MAFLDRRRALNELDPELLPNGGSALHVAAAGGSVQDCMLLVEDAFSGPDTLETLDIRSRTPLAAALLNGRRETSRYLLRRGARTDAKYAPNSTIRQYLESYACVEFAASLVKEGIAVGNLVPNKVFLMSAQDGDKSLMQACLEQYQVDANHCDELGRTALHETCMKGFVECTTLLVHHQARLDVYDNSQSTPLHYACRYGHENTVNFLATEFGQTMQQIVNIADAAGRTPLHAAAEYRHMDVLIQLLQLFSCDTEVPDNCGVTVQQHLYWAYLECRMDVASLVPLVPYFMQDFCDALLHEAVFQNQIGVVTQLIRAGARVDQFDPSVNHNPMLLAARLGETDMVALLLEEGASATALDVTLQTPLHLAARGCHRGTVARLLQEYTIDVNALDRRGYTAFCYALEQKHAPTVECFLDHYMTQTAKPCQEGSLVNQVLDLLAEWENEEILHRTLPLLGDVVAALTFGENIQPPLPNAAACDINCGQIQKLDFTSKKNPPYPALLQRCLLKAQPCKSIICLFCLGFVPKKLFQSHFYGGAGSCRGFVQESHSEDGRRWFNEAANVTTVQQIQSLNKATLAKKCSVASPVQSKESEDVSISCRRVTQNRVLQRLHKSRKLHKPRSPAVYGFFPLHTAAHARNAAFLIWILGHTSSQSEQQHILTTKNAAGQTVIEIIICKGFEKKIASCVDHTVFEKLVKDVEHVLVPPSQEKRPAVTFRRTWSMRVRHDVKTAHERSQDIIQKKKDGSRMRLTDSDYSLLCHSLYHQTTLSHADSEIITSILVTRLKIAGSRTTPCTCRCSAHSRVLYLHRTVHLVLQCYREGVQRERLQKLINTLCLHRHLDKSLQWTEIENSLDAPHKLIEWWAVFSGSVHCHVPNLLTSVCMFGNADQAKVLLPWAPEGALMEEDPDMELNALQHAVRRTQPSLTRLLLEEVPEQEVTQMDRDGDLLVLCCYGVLNGMKSSNVKKVSANQDVSPAGLQSGADEMWCLDFEQRRRQLLDLLLSRHDYTDSPEILDTALCEAVQRGWWWGASKLVAAGASPHAAYKTSVGKMEKEESRYALVHCLNAGQIDTFCTMLSGVSTAVLQNTSFTAELIKCLPCMTAEGLHDQVISILYIIPNPAMLWEGLHPPACRLAQVRQSMGLTPLEVPLPDQIQDSHLKTMAKYGMTDSLTRALQKVLLPCPELCYSHLVHLAASSGQLHTVEAVYEHLHSYGTSIQNELQAVTSWSISTPWSDSESVFWSIVLYTAASCGHEGLALRAITRIMSAVLNNARCMTEVQNTSMGYTVLHWVCYWGMEGLLMQISNLLPEHFTDLHKAPLTPLDCAIGMAKLSAVVKFVNPAAIVTDLASHFFDFDESDDLSEGIYVLEQCCTSVKQLSVKPSIAALFYLLTLGWFTRLMECNTIALREGVTPEGSESSTPGRLTKCSTLSGTPTFAASIAHFLYCLIQGEDKVVSAFLGGPKLRAVSEGLLTILVEESSVPLFQLAARSCSVFTLVALLQAFSKAPRRSINFTCRNAVWPALFVSAQHGNALIASELLAHGADMGFRDKQKQNVLHIAVSSGSVDTVKCLLNEKHSKILMLEASASGISPLQIAIQNGSYEIVFAMKNLVPAKRWMDQTEGHHTCYGWFDYLMKQNVLGWEGQGFTAVPSATYSLRALTKNPLDTALNAARYNHPFILYSILRICTDFAKQMCDMKEAYLPAFAEVALTQEDIVLPYIKVPLLVQCMRFGHEESMVQLLRAKLRHDPLYVTDASSLVEREDCFRTACKIGSEQLLSCLMEFGVLSTMSEATLMEGIKDMILLGYAHTAAQFLFDTSLSLEDTGWNWDQFPLIFQSIFNPNFSLMDSFDLKKMGYLAFSLQDMWLSYKGWTSDLLQLVQSTNHSVVEVVSQRKQGAMALPLHDQPPIPLTVDWQAFDRLSGELRTSSYLQHCPLLTECVVFSSMVVHGIAQLCTSTTDEVEVKALHISVTVDSNPDLQFMDGSCSVCLSYSTHHKALVFPETSQPVSSLSSVSPIIRVECADVVQGVFAHSLKQVLSAKHKVITDCKDVDEQWINFPDTHDSILAVVMHLAADLEAVLSTLLAPNFQLFPEANGPQLGDGHTAGTVLRSSYSSLVAPVLRRLQEVHVKLVMGEDLSAFYCSVEDSVLELTYTLVADDGNATHPHVEGTLPDVVLHSLASCLLQTRSEELVTSLCCRLRQAFAVSESTLGDTDIAITMPDGQLLENVEEPRLQAAMLKWLLRPASNLMIFLELAEVAQNIPAFKDSYHSLLWNGLNINVQLRGFLSLSTKKGVFNLAVPVVRDVTPLGPLFADLAASCSVPSHLHSLAAIEHLVYPSRCQLTEASALALQYATVGTVRFSVLLCNSSGKVFDREPSNLTSVDITITSLSASKLVQYHWQRQRDDSEQTMSDPLLLVRKDADQGCISCEWQAQDMHCHSVRIRVNGTDISHSPVRLFVGSRLKSRDHSAMTSKHGRPTLPSRYLTHSLNQVSHWFLVQDHYGEISCGAGRPLVFLLSHAHDKGCTSIPKANVPARLQRSSSGDIIKVEPPTYSRLQSISGNSPTPQHEESYKQHPRHFLTVCAERGGYSNWLSFSAGNVQVLVLPKNVNKKDISYWKQNMRVHSVKLDYGRYRLAVLQPCCGSFRVMAACASCQEELHVHCSTPTPLSKPILCTVLPGLVDPQHTILASSMAGIQEVKNGTKRKDCLPVCYAGAQATFYFCLRDIFYNCLTSDIGLGSLTLSVLHGGRRASLHSTPPNAPCTVNHIQNGVFKATCTPYSSGKLPIILGKGVLQSNLVVRHVAPSAESTTVNYPSSVLPSLRQWRCVINLRDVYGNDVSNRSSSISINAVLNRTTSTATDVRQVPRSPGTYHGTVFCSGTGVYEVRVTVDSEPLSGTPIQFTVMEQIVDKYAKLKEYLNKWWRQGSTPTMTMDRANILECAINLLTDQVLCKTIRVRFNDEPGIDLGGVSREFFELLGEALVNPNYALFEEVGGKFRPNPNSSINPNHLFYFNFTGKFLAKAVADGHLLTVRFTPTVYKHLCGQPCILDDLQEEDPTLHSGLVQVSQCSSASEVSSLHLTFISQTSRFGSVQTAELEPGGATKEVTLDNRDEYLQKIVEYYMYDSVKEQLKQLKEGFNVLIPSHLLVSFTAKELEQIISGEHGVDVHVLQKRAKYTAGYTKGSEVIRWLWEVLAAYSEEMQSKFLMFCTGSSSVPASFMEWHLGISRTSNQGQLPTASTCSRLLFLPEYHSKQELEEKLTQAVSLGAYSFHLH